MNYTELKENIKEFLIFELQIMEFADLEDRATSTAIIHEIHNRFFPILKMLPHDDLEFMVRSVVRMRTINLNTLEYLLIQHSFGADTTDIHSRWIVKILNYIYWDIVQDYDILAIRELRNGF